MKIAGAPSAHPCEHQAWAGQCVAEVRQREREQLQNKTFWLIVAGCRRNFGTDASVLVVGEETVDALGITTGLGVVSTSARPLNYCIRTHCVSGGQPIPYVDIVTY